MIRRSTTSPTRCLRGEHGELIRWQVVESSFTLRYRIMYLSTTLSGAPTLVTALVDAPEDAAPFGGHRMLLYGHGATGFDDACAPSAAVDDPVDGDGGRVRVDVLGGMGARRDRLSGPRRPRPASAAASAQRGTQHARRRPRRPPAPHVVRRHRRRQSPIRAGRARRLVGGRAGARVDTGAVDRGHGGCRPGDRDRQPGLVGGSPARPRSVAAGDRRWSGDDVSGGPAGSRPDAHPVGIGAAGAVEQWMLRRRGRRSLGRISPPISPRSSRSPR